MLTPTEKKALSCIKSYISQHQESPTVAELAQMMGIQSRGVVHRYLKSLAKKEKIQLKSQRWRNIELIEDSDVWQKIGSIPLIGSIAAGLPIEAIEDNESVEVASLFMGTGRYALRVKGESMIDEGIFDGDIVVCQMSDTAQNGQIVVALVDNDQATLKKIRYNNDETITLSPANSRFEAQQYHMSRVRVQGIFIGLLRLST